MNKIYANLKFTILTSTINSKEFNARWNDDKFYLFKKAKTVLKNNTIRTLIRKMIEKKVFKLGGHSAVTRSLLDGLSKINNISFNYNPKSVNELNEILVVLSGVDALKQGIYFKEKGFVKFLIAGPNIVVRSNDYASVLGNENVDLCLVPSEWVKDFYIEDLPSLKEKIEIWYAGVDEEFWNPNIFKSKVKDRVLIYIKNYEKDLISEIEKILKKSNFKYQKIIYGYYDKKQYRNLLSKSLFIIFISKSESQGIALAEAWAMNVPTLVWNPGQNIIGGKPIFTSSSPYITSQTGLVFRNIEEFEQIIQNILLKLNEFSPRDWVLKNMTDKKSAELFISIIKQYLNK
ncbi:glycosyltransferase family 1 protein [Carboxydothermus pertinax]|uniref:Glycosyl transferase family 1 domain-containing protein n=1 Tax=Carboxydothermus pertinax TaxID=870242 RepID=A0A1L8CUM3_9THEO|nr:glycosyltransferase family 1 protein [Carboxydothermus pertinax]GAV22601.1 hypothetical protein cpu_11110 [Carboxydothermus pertinax]